MRNYNKFFHFFWRLPQEGVGYIRWRIGQVGWVNRGGLLDGYFLIGSYHWPRSRMIQRVAPGPWWKPWRHVV